MRFLGAFFLSLAVVATVAGADEFVRLGEPEVDDLQIVGFELDGPAEIAIEAVGILDHDEVPLALRWIVRLGQDDDDPQLSVNAWLLDAATREPVWVMRADDSYSVGGRLRGVEETLRLDAGRYELYLASTHPWARWIRDDDSGETRSWWQRLIPDERRRTDDLREELARCHVSLSAAGLDRARLRTFEPTGDVRDGVLAVNRLGDSRLERRGIAVDSPTRFGLYGVFEHLRDDRAPADFAWIVDEATRRTVWHASGSRTRAAGGSSKNREVDDELLLEPGRYVLHVGTDDSHSLEAFNAAPPYDPLNWGLTLTAGDGYDPRAVSFFDPIEPGPPLIDFSAVGNSELLEQPFRMERDGRIRLRASGELVDRDDSFADGAWIEGAESGETAWRMTRGETQPAGGAEKNRMFDGVIELPRGDYVLYYSSDDSHAYGDWNAATPFEPEAWGVTLRAADGTRGGDIRLIDAKQIARDERVLAAIVRVGDDERKHERFTLDAPTRVEVRALGEGSGGSMHDVGRIRDEQGRVAWEMTYRDTEHAGGAEKNRIVTAELTLDPGTWIVEYESDGSHSFPRWNAGAPRDPTAWGITVRRAEP